MDKIRPDTASTNCKNIFKSDNVQNRKDNFTQKMAELINQQERAKQIHITSDD